MPVCRVSQPAQVRVEDSGQRRITPLPVPRAEKWTQESPSDRVCASRRCTEGQARAHLCDVTSPRPTQRTGQATAVPTGRAKEEQRDRQKASPALSGGRRPHGGRTGVVPRVETPAGSWAASVRSAVTARRLQEHSRTRRACGTRTQAAGPQSSQRPSVHHLLGPCLCVFIFSQTALSTGQAQGITLSLRVRPRSGGLLCHPMVEKFAHGDSKALTQHHTTSKRTRSVCPSRSSGSWLCAPPAPEI